MKPQFFTLLLLLSPLALHGEDHYRVVFSDDIGKVTVDACFDGAAPRYLYRNEDAATFTDWIRTTESEIHPESRHGRLTLPKLPPDNCLSWQVDLFRAAASSDYRLAMQIDGGYLTSGNLWFWRDNDYRPLRIEVTLPPDVSLSTPWRQRHGADVLTYTPVPTPASWSSRIAVGAFPVQHIPVPGTQVLLAAVGEQSEEKLNDFSSWISESAQSVASVLGEFPLHDTQILIVPIGPRSKTVPFGHVIRGGGEAVELFVDETRSLKSFREDWVATHELSHLLLPFVTKNDRWLSEGLASYYQVVLRARDGRLSEEEAWRALNSGFERGRAATRQGVSLATATRTGRNNIMRIYWSGAAIMLKADTQLRLSTDGRQSLDTALAGLYGCCFDTRKSWRAKDLFAQFDRLTGHRIFTNLYREHVKDDSFPDVSLTYEKLGVVPGIRNVTLDEQAPWRQIRQGIMKRRDLRAEIP